MPPAPPIPSNTPTRPRSGPSRTIGSESSPWPGILARLKAKDRLGWTPTVSFAELVAMMVDADIAAAKAGW